MKKKSSGDGESNRDKREREREELIGSGRKRWIVAST